MAVATYQWQLTGEIDPAVDVGVFDVDLFDVPDDTLARLKSDGRFVICYAGFDLTGTDQLEFNRFIADQAHERGLSVGLKNDVDQLVALEPCFDWALNEECYAYDECDRYAPFVDAGKAVLHVEYVDDVDDGAALVKGLCGDATLDGFSTLVKEWDLTAWRIACD